jgi:phenylalanyl-tRNA synthetase beta subunit
MGGEETGVTEATTNVLFEAAWFTPSNIRRTSRRLGLSSDSSYRFERGIDPQQVQAASELATKLILWKSLEAPPNPSSRSPVKPRSSSVTSFSMKPAR